MILVPLKRPVREVLNGTKFIKNNIGLLVAGGIGLILVTILIYSVIGDSTNDNFNNTQDMFADCVPVNGRCP